MGTSHEKFYGAPNRNRALRVVWGAKVHPKLPRKIIGEAYFPVLAPGKNISLKPKNQVFLPWEPCLGPQNMDQEFQKWVSDTSTGQKQHIFTHIISKNYVLVPSDTSQFKLKTGPYLKNQVSLGNFYQFLGLQEMNQKFENFISSTCMG